MIERFVTEKICDLGQAAEPERWAPLRRLAGVLAFKQFPDGRFHDGHWWRGPLLYSLARRIRPRHVLEFGTGRGYAAACVAQASLDGGFDCTVWSVDALPHDRAQSWAFELPGGAALRRMTRAEVWAAYLPAELAQRIRCLTGDSRSVMRRWKAEGLPTVDLCFIDGGHDAWTVTHDFLAALRVASRGCTFLFDDYTDRKGYGVKRLVDRRVAARFAPEAVEILDMGCHDRTVHGEDVPHKMALIQGSWIGEDPLAQFCSPRRAAWFDRAYRTYDAARRLRWRVRVEIRPGAGR